MRYRSEVDGLRAVAVVPVILFHAGFSGFTGGYIGVDIFFVISGYLIGSILLKELAEDRYSLVGFYERRARRILPALTVMLLATTLFAYLFMPPGYLLQYSQSLVAVVLFSSNIFFYLTTDYFSTASDEKPLLHTWSLGVEEQYYLFFPILLAFLFPRGRRYIAGSLIGLSVLSLLSPQYFIARDAVAANFFLIMSRAWELFAGSLIAMIPVHQWRKAHSLKNMLSLLGFAMLAYSVVFFSAEIPYPSFYTLIPILGTCLIILFADGSTWLGKALSVRPLVFIGVLSYSLYLWHQPIFAFLRLKSLGEPTHMIFWAAIALTMIMGYLSWRYVEQPFRNRNLFPRKRVFVGAFASLAIFFSVGIAGHFNQGFEQRFKVVNYEKSIRHSPKRKLCHYNSLNYQAPEKACRYFGSDITWAVFGDSHMVEPAYVLAKKLQKDDVGIVHLSFAGCPPALLFDVKIPGCAEWVRRSTDFLIQQPEIQDVLLGFRYSLFLYGDQLDVYPNIPDEDPSAMINSKNSLTADAAREIYWRSLLAVIDGLQKAGKRVHIMYPVPELPTNIEKAVAPVSVLGSKTMLDLEHASTEEYYFERNHFILEKLDSLPYSETLTSIKPYDIFCSRGYCPAVKDGKALYFDDDHLSLAGAKLIVDSMYLSDPFNRHAFNAAVE